jgi:hypothetical protein
MGKYFQAAEYYPDDKDIYDFLDSQCRTTDMMLTYLRTRGIFAAQQAQKEYLQRYISLLHFDWLTAVQLVETVDLREMEEKQTNRKVEIAADAVQIYDALQVVQKDRQQQCREVYRTTQKGNTVIATVKYLDIDTSKSRVIQKRERDLEIRITHDAGQISITHTATPRAKAITESILSALMKSTDVSELNDHCIDLSRIRDHKLRLKFFIKMMRELPGMTLLDVCNIKVDRVPPTSEEIADDEQNEEATHEAHEKLKRAVLMGEQLLLTREFSELTSRGFFISSANWISEKNDTRGIKVEFHAGFGESAEGRNFSYRVIGEYHRDEAGDLQTDRKKVCGSDRLAYQDALEKSAYAALDAVERSIKDAELS